jgi:hypothetical protein
LRRRACDGLIFPSLRNGSLTPFNGWSKSKSALDKECLISGWTLHDLRRTFAEVDCSLHLRKIVISVIDAGYARK